MSRDVLLYGCSQAEWVADLLAWKQHTPELHDFPMPDAHRLQLEHWIWSRRNDLGKNILDVGVYVPRRWLGDGYITFGENGEDRQGDLLALPFPENSLDGVILTEVLEHCTDPVGGINQCRRVLKPGGLLLVTSPFLWPEHQVEGQYNDYWRFTRQGWELLLKDFSDVQITPCAFTPEGQAAYDFMRRFECMGFVGQTHATTGYLCAARKA
jgi:SAM-dependent methyltransferase